ncbi:MAG: response regulator transcription factor [Dermatophilaceae bacterium]
MSVAPQDGVPAPHVAGWSAVIDRICHDRQRAVDVLMVAILFTQSMLAFIWSEAANGLYLRDDLPDQTPWLVPTATALCATVWFRRRWPAGCALACVGIWLFTHQTVVRQSFADFAIPICFYSVGRYGSPRTMSLVLTLIGVGAAAGASTASPSDATGIVVGYLELGVLPAVLGLVVRRIHDGRPAPATPVPTSVALSERERSVVALLARGLTNAEIAAELHLSPETVKTHVSRSLHKLDLRNRVELATWFHRMSRQAPVSAARGRRPPIG